MDNYNGSTLCDFLAANRLELIERCRAKIAFRSAPKANDAELEHGVPLFLDQIVKTLRFEMDLNPVEGRKVSGSSVGEDPVFSEIGASATRHGKELLMNGVTIDQVVHDYGDLCQAVTELATEQEVPIQANEFRIFNRCLDNAIAGAVTEYSYQRDVATTSEQAQASNERLGALAHELRNLTHTATLAYTAIKTGSVGVTGATGAILDRSLRGMSKFIDSSLAEIQMESGIPPRFELISLADLVAEIKISGALQAQSRGCGFSISTVDPELAVEADRDLLLAAVGNLLQNAFKYTRPHTEVSLNAYATADRILIDVADHCGGLLPGCVEVMFVPFAKYDERRSGVGLGLSISRRSIESNNGTLSVRNVPDHGCIFTIGLPRRSMPRLR